MGQAAMEQVISSQQQTRLLDLILDHCRRQPERAAIVVPGGQAMTYGNMLEHVIGNALKLRELGIRKNDRVAVVMPNGPEMINAFLAVTAVATCAPLNPAYALDEFAFYLSDVGAKAVIVSEGLETKAAAAARELGIAVITLRPENKGEAGAFTLAGEIPLQAAGLELAEPEDVALVLHTSGTTGRPKIVPLTHRNLYTSARNIAQSLALGRDDTCLNVMPLFHVHGLLAAVLASLGAGGRVATTPGFEASKFLSWLAELSPTWYTAVPTMHQAVVSLLEQADKQPFTGSLRFIRSSSAALPPVITEKLEAAFGVPVIEAYGMTEASHQMAVNPLPPGIRKPGSVGKAAGCRVSIMDAAGKLLPTGATGEIVIRGDNVVSGYENNPKANQDNFCEGWFRTGDQGYIDGEGYLFINGRLKEIINRGGEKVSPREIDEVLLKHPAVEQAAAFAIPHATLGEDIGAVVVRREDSGVSEKELRWFAAEHLAHFKVPAKIVFATEIPKGPTGKVQRVGLAERLGVSLAAACSQPDAGRGPQSPEEQMIAGFWQEVFPALELGVHEDFFAIGGNSIQAMQVIARIRKETGIPLEFAEFFYAPTIAELAELVKMRAEG